MVSILPMWDSVYGQKATGILGTLGLSLPRPCVFSSARQESGLIRSFVVVPHHADWLLDSLDCSPYDVIQMTMIVLTVKGKARYLI